MDGTRDLQQLLTAFKAGEAGADALAAAADWRPETDGPLGRFLVGRGLLSDALADRLGGAATTAEFPPPADDPNDTPAHPPAPPRPGTPTVTMASGPAGRGALRPPPRYTLHHPHDAGGLGEVWLARDAVLDRLVAIKAIRPDRSHTPAACRRFVREGQLTGQLEHPGIVPVYDLDPGAPDAGRSPSYVMRFVAGETLFAAIHRYHQSEAAGPDARLRFVRLLDAFIAVCRAVGYAHSKRVVHRDLKGPNVILGEFGEVFVIDWGLAKRVGDPDPADPGEWPAATGETPNGAMVGTPPYMALELATGASANPQTDIYALGVVLYHILTGQLPVEGKTPDEVFDRLRAGPLPPPKVVANGVPPALDAICCKAMARLPADRYASAEALAADVRRWLADEPVDVYPEPWLVRAGRWAKRHRSKVAAAGVALATATVALGISTAVVWTEKQKTDEARRQAEENLDALARMTNGIIDQTERELPPIPGTEVVRREILTPVQGQYRQMLVQRPADPAVREWSAKVERYVANLDRMVGEYVRANECYERSVHLLTGLAAQFPDEPRHREKLSEAVRDYAELLRRLGNLPAADGATRRAVELAEPLHAAAPGAFGPKRTLGTALIERAEVRAAQGRWADAEADAGRAVALLVQLADAPAAEQVASDPVMVSLARTQLAAAQREQGRPADALRTHEAAVAGGEPVATDANAQYARARGRLERGRTLGQLGRPADRLADVTAAVGGFGGLAGRYPKVVRYREWLAAARNELAAGR